MSKRYNYRDLARLAKLTNCLPHHVPSSRSSKDFASDSCSFCSSAAAESPEIVSPPVQGGNPGQQIAFIGGTMRLSGLSRQPKDAGHSFIFCGSLKKICMELQNWLSWLVPSHPISPLPAQLSQVLPQRNCRIVAPSISHWVGCDGGVGGFVVRSHSVQPGFCVMEPRKTCHL